MTDQDLQPLSPATLQEQLAQRIRDRIVSGELSSGDKLPSEHELCQMYGVSRVTVRGALGDLVGAGLLMKRQGKGTFVRERAFRESVFTTGSFTDTCLRIGATPATRIVSVGRCAAPREVARQLPGDDPIVKVERLRIVDGLPCILEVDYLPAEFDFMLERDLADRSLLELIRTHTGRVAVGFEDLFHIASATEEQARLLECDACLPLLKVEQTVTSASGAIIYLNHQFIVTERYVYAVKSKK